MIIRIIIDKFDIRELLNSLKKMMDAKSELYLQFRREVFEQPA